MRWSGWVNWMSVETGWNYRMNNLNYQTCFVTYFFLIWMNWFFSSRDFDYGCSTIDAPVEYSLAKKLLWWTWWTSCFSRKRRYSYLIKATLKNNIHQLLYGNPSFQKKRSTGKSLCTFLNNKGAMCINHTILLCGIFACLKCDTQKTPRGVLNFDSKKMSYHIDVTYWYFNKFVYFHSQKLMRGGFWWCHLETRFHQFHALPFFSPMILLVYPFFAACLNFLDETESFTSIVGKPESKLLRKKRFPMVICNRFLVDCLCTFHQVVSYETWLSKLDVPTNWMTIQFDELDELFAHPVWLTGWNFVANWMTKLDEILLNWMSKLDEKRAHPVWQTGWIVAQTGWVNWMDSFLTETEREFLWNGKRCVCTQPNQKKRAQNSSFETNSCGYREHLITRFAISAVTSWCVLGRSVRL